MLLIIVFLILGSLLAYVSQQNLMPVAVTIGPYVITDIPLFYVIIASLVIGLILAYMYSLANSIAHSMALEKKAKELDEADEEIAELTKRVHQLELENEKLKANFDNEPEDVYAL